MAEDVASAAKAVESDPSNLSVADLHRRFQDGSLSPVEALEAVFARIDRYEPQVNAFVFQDREASLAMARASEQRHREGRALGPLDGAPTSIKDLQPVAGWPLRRGSLALDPTAPAPADSPPVARLREAGCVFIGKTATPEAGSRIVTRSRAHGVTRNPYALDRTPGGSSGGASAALALGMGTLALGTDGAGSIRIPAAFCNLVGLKPGFGRVPVFPPSNDMPMSVVGPMARRVADVAAMAAVMAGPEPRDAFAWPARFDVDAAAPGSLVGLRVALSPTLGLKTAADVDAVAALGAAAAALEAAGAQVERADPIWPVDPYEPFMAIWLTSCVDMIARATPEAATKIDPLIHDLAARGRKIDVARWLRAVDQRLEITSASHAFLTKYDAVLAPVMPGPAFDVEAEAPPGESADDWRWCPYTYLFNLAGQPALSVPGGFTGGGLPVGLQLGARAGREETLLRLGAAIEAALDLVDRRPALLGT